MRPSDIAGMMMKSKLDLVERNYKKEDVWFVLEDRQMVVNMWRSLGLLVYNRLQENFDGNKNNK